MKGKNIMKIAVTYENGEVFQHFGHTENFKVYEVEDNKVVSSEVIGSNGSGHGALATMLAGNGIDVLICGGIGGGAQTALMENGIELCAGASGNTDEAVEAYLRGELINTGANCDHHGEGHTCGSYEEGHCPHPQAHPGGGPGPDALHRGHRPQPGAGEHPPGLCGGDAEARHPVIGRCRIGGIPHHRPGTEDVL